MEALYSKLYNKYSKLKNEKESKLDKLNREQEVKFMNYAAAADEMIEYLKSENERLHVNALKSESASTSCRPSNDELIHCQKLLVEGDQKNKALSEEISRPRKLVQDHAMDKEIGNGHQNSRQNSPNTEGTPSRSTSKSSKKRKIVHTTEGKTTNSYIDGQLEHPSNEHVSGDKSSSAPIQQPDCCQSMVDISGGSTMDTVFLFQNLVELVFGMEVSPLAQSKERGILAIHQSSGYSFNLTWITRSAGETELLYRVVSLGTFERVAPEWMREMMIFNTSMCKIFFEKLSRFTKC